MIKTFITFLFGIFKGAEGDDGEKSLQATLDENLELMGNLLKSGDDMAGVRELMKDPRNRSKVKEMMDEFDGDDEEGDGGKKKDDDEEEGKEKMTHKRERMVQDSNNGKEALPKHDYMTKKSLDNVLEENEDVIDAVPVLKSFAEVLGNLVDEMYVIKSAVERANDTIDNQNEVIKSFGSVLKTSAELIKSTNEVIDQVGGQPQRVKGLPNGSEILNKSFGDGSNFEGPVQYPISAVKNALLKSVQAGNIPSATVSRWEMSRYNFGSLNHAEQSLVKSMIEKGE